MRQPYDYLLREIILPDLRWMITGAFVFLALLVPLISWVCGGQHLCSITVWLGAALFFSAIFYIFHKTVRHARDLSLAAKPTLDLLCEKHGIYRHLTHPSPEKYVTEIKLGVFNSSVSATVRNVELVLVSLQMSGVIPIPIGQRVHEHNGTNYIHARATKHYKIADYIEPAPLESMDANTVEALRKAGVKLPVCAHVEVFGHKLAPAREYMLKLQLSGDTAPLQNFTLRIMTYTDKPPAVSLVD